MTSTKGRAKHGPAEPVEVRELQRKAELVLGLLADGQPHTRSEIGVLARKHGISDSQLGAIKAAYSIDHVRVQPGGEHGLGRSVFAWVLRR
jgi:hypothetical protein